MRSEIKKHVVKTFRRAFEAQYSRFSPLKLPAGTPKVWGWRMAPDLHFFVLLQPFSQEDVFTLEIAWSEDGEFPWARKCGQTFKPDQPFWRTRLSRLWQPFGKEVVWSATPEVDEMMDARLDALRRGESVSYPLPPPPAVEVVIPRMAPLVEDCLEKFREYALPVFEQVAEARGLGHVLENNE